VQYVFLWALVAPNSRTAPGRSHWPHGAHEDIYAARDASREFLYNQDLTHSVYSSVFGSSRPVSEQVPFERTYRRLEMVYL